MTRHTPLFLMCPPTYFDLAPPDPDSGFPNDMIHQNYTTFQAQPKLFKEKAQKQWDLLKETLLQHLGAEILELSPQKGLEDQTYTADASLSLVLDKKKSVTLLSRFSHPEREEEVDLHHQFLKKKFPNQSFVFHKFSCEGTGDNVYDPFRNVFWSGYTKNPDEEHVALGRSSKKAHETLSKATGVKVVSLEVQRPFFHVDTTLFPLSKGHVLVYPEGLHAASYKDLCTHVRRDLLITINHKEALTYSCNGICWGDKVILPECGERLPALLSKKGYDVKTVDISALLMAGGGPHCLVNALNLRKTEGR